MDSFLICINIDENFVWFCRGMFIYGFIICIDIDKNLYEFVEVCLFMDLLFVLV